MTVRRINLDYRNLPDPQLIAWLEANSVDHENVPFEQEVLVSDDAIVFMEFVPRAGEHRVLARNGLSYQKRASTVPLISAPENFGF